MAPITALWEFRVYPEGVFKAQVLILKQSYLFVQLAMVFDRIFAVFTPFKYQHHRRLSNKILLGIFVSLQLLIQISVQASGQIETDYLTTVNNSIIFGTILVVFLIIATAYPTIACELLARNRKVVPQTSIGITAQAVNKRDFVYQTSKKHEAVIQTVSNGHICENKAGDTQKPSNKLQVT